MLNVKTETWKSDYEKIRQLKNQKQQEKLVNLQHRKFKSSEKETKTQQNNKTLDGQTKKDCKTEDKTMNQTAKDKSNNTKTAEKTTEENITKIEESLLKNLHELNEKIYKSNYNSSNLDNSDKTKKRTINNQENAKSVKKSSAKNHVVKMLNSFIYESKFDLHFCLVFELLDTSLRTVMNRYEKKGIPIKLAKEIIRQILTGLHYIHRHCNVVYNNLQPENVMFAYSETDRLKIEQSGVVRVNKRQEQTKLMIVKDVIKSVKKQTDLQNKGRISKSMERKITHFHHNQTVDFQKNYKVGMTISFRNL